MISDLVLFHSSRFPSAFLPFTFNGIYGGCYPVFALLVNILKAYLCAYTFHFKDNMTKYDTLLRICTFENMAAGWQFWMSLLVLEKCLRLILYLHTFLMQSLTSSLNNVSCSVIDKRYVYPLLLFHTETTKSVDNFTYYLVLYYL